MITDRLEDFPDAGFGAVLADPPWRFKSWSKNGDGRAADQHYPTMTLADIKAMGEQVQRIVKPDCWLFLWITGPFAVLGEHVKVMQAWGFKPSALGFVWVKLQNREEEALFVNADDSYHTGLGKTTRHNAELCFLGRRGKPPRLSKGVRELIVAPVREHSRKPIETHERVEEYCGGPYLEMFGRRIPSTKNTGAWSVFGNELANIPSRGLSSRPGDTGVPSIPVGDGGNPSVLTAVR